MRATIVLCCWLCMLLASCDEVNMSTVSLIGTWEADQSEYTQYKKVKHIKKNTYGFTFKEGGELVMYAMDGWCATPPVNYGAFDGTWSVEQDILTIQVDLAWYFLDHRYRIIEIATDKLVLESVDAATFNSN